ncbi:transporter [Gluconacetobacter sp. 1c LMG 22058]|uniref:Transporter n=1 Tax=Gluconacetobacter dulcium TaxID=2729096 RepID=A0A7W4PK84_9PROT|nr:gluconate:H+ symporter [Gluconacetobacter dulcium]MBB2197606.1 transporter [Gluconacetobacter dulcium]
MNSVLLLGSALAGIGLMVLLLLRYRLQPLLALLIASLAVAILSGMTLDKIMPAIEQGMGKTLGHIAIIIALGAMVGRLVEVSGGASRLARDLIGKFGRDRVTMALTLAGFLVGVPVFFEVGVIIAMPLVYGVASASRGQIMTFALPMCAAMLTVHSFLPPHPGPAAAAALIGADLGRVLLFGIPITLILCCVGYQVAGWMTRRRFSISRDVATALRETSPPVPGGLDSGHEIRLPPAPDPALWVVVGLILLPVLMIMAGTVGKGMVAPGSALAKGAVFIGSPITALLADTMLAGWVLGLRRGWSYEQVSEVVGSAVPGVAMVIMIAGAGGVFGNILVQSGVGGVVSTALQATGLPPLALAFLLSCLLRAVQGSTTVALVTTAGILGPMIAGLHLGPDRLALLTLAMGGGGLSMSHMNDAGFWIFVKLTGIETGEGLRTWTVLTTVLGFLGFCMTAMIWPFVS